MKKSHLLTSIVGATVADSITLFASEQSESQIQAVGDTMFSMESMFSGENYSEDALKLANHNKSIVEASEGIVDQMVASLAQTSAIDSENETENRLAAAKVLFGDATVNKAVREGNTESILTMLGDAGSAMVETMFAIKAENGVDNLNSIVYDGKAEGLTTVMGNHTEDFSMEAFDKFDPEKHASVTMMLSAMSVVESPVVRLNYPTYRLAAGQNVITLELSQEYLIGNDVRGGKGKAFTKNDTPLIESYFRSDMWGDNRLECIPVYDDAQAEYFVDKALTGLIDVTDELGNPFKSAYLKFGKDVDLISIASSRGEIKNRAQDRTDQLDPSFSLKTLVLEVANSDASTVEGFTVPVAHLMSAQSRKEPQGSGRDFSINFSEKEVRAAKPALMTDGGEVTNLTAIMAAYAGGLVFNVQASFSRINLTEATVNPMASIEVVGAYDVNGQFVPVTDATLAPLVADLKFEAKGYALNINRTDTNFSNNGKEIEQSSFTRNYPVGFSPRIQVRNPVGSNSVEDARLLDSALRKVTREKVVNAMHDKFTTLKEYTDNGKGAIPTGSAFPSYAFGDFVTIPSLRYQEYSPSVDTMSRCHAERMADARAHVVGILRTLITEVTHESRLKTVAKDLNKGVEDIKVNITVDPRINQLLMVEGDDKLLTTAFKNFEIIEDEADVFEDHIYVTFSVDTPYDISPISNGIRAVGISPVVKFDPEMINGTKIAKTFVQPRELVLDTNNIMAVVKINDLDKLMAFTNK